MTGGGEQPVLVGDKAHQEKAGDEDERRPVLRRRRSGVLRAEERSTECSGTSNSGHGPSQPTGAVRELRRVWVPHFAIMPVIGPGQMRNANGARDPQPT